MPKANPENRCQQISAHARQCRSLRAPEHSSLCSYHAKEQKQKENDSASIALDLLGPTKEFYTALSVNYVIGRLFVLQACDRIPPRKAAVLAYTCQLLLQSQQELKDELRAVSPELSKLVNYTYGFKSPDNAVEMTPQAPEQPTDPPATAKSTPPVSPAQPQKPQPTPPSHPEKSEPAPPVAAPAHPPQPQPFGQAALPAHQYYFPRKD